MTKKEKFVLKTLMKPANLPLFNCPTIQKERMKQPYSQPTQLVTI
jgi:hypothetical protein